MQEYILDGNNIIGKSGQLQKLKHKNPQASREGLIDLLNSHFAGKKATVVLCFDGFEKEKLEGRNIKTLYSQKKEADAIIKDLISKSKNPKKITVVSSDNSVAGFARKCSCTVITAEEFLKSVISGTNDSAENETNKVEKLQNDKKYFIELFGEGE